MSLFNIKTESLSKRCEICHQSDMFDANAEECYRCKIIKTTIQNNQISANQARVEPTYRPYKPLFSFYTSDAQFDLTTKIRLAVFIGLFLVRACFYLSPISTIFAILFIAPFFIVFIVFYLENRLSPSSLSLSDKTESSMSQEEISKYERIDDNSPYWLAEFDKNV